MSNQNKVPEHLARLSRFMDSSIKLPGGYRIGWDGIIGLIPGIGDVVGVGVSAYIIVGAARSGASLATLVRMMLNVGLEALVGLIPVLGDLFDLTFKANQRNMRLLDQQLTDSGATSVRSKLVLAALAITFVTAFTLLIWAAISLLIKLFSVIF